MGLKKVLSACLPFDGLEKSMGTQPPDAQHQFFGTVVWPNGRRNGERFPPFCKNGKGIAFFMTDLFKLCG